MTDGGILLYLDEIQYFNKRQQQSLLECVEQGTVTLIASTTENPYFYVYNALLSRCTVFEFKAADRRRTSRQGLHNAAARLGGRRPELRDSDMARPTRWTTWPTAPAAICARPWATWSLPSPPRRSQDGTPHRRRWPWCSRWPVRTAMRYDRQGDDHYDIISAYQKSMRGLRPGRGAALSGPAAGSGGSALRLPSAAGDGLRGRGAGLSA